jgi:hypothetical protein
MQDSKKAAHPGKKQRMPRLAGLLKKKRFFLQIRNT